MEEIWLLAIDETRLAKDETLPTDEGRLEPDEEALDTLDTCDLTEEMDEACEVAGVLKTIDWEVIDGLTETELTGVEVCPYGGGDHACVVGQDPSDSGHPPPYDSGH